MAVPYPADGPIPRSQEMDFRIAVASRVMLSVIDELPNWEQISKRLAAELGLNLQDQSDRALVQTAFLEAELDLEWTNAVVYERDHFRRPSGTGDPAPVPPERLREVAEAVWSLGWPNPDYKPSRSIHECFMALGGRYRHCDVYWAMHKYLKGNRLRVVRRNWMLLADVEAVLADPTLSADEREELERQLEKDLVLEYLTWLGPRGSWKAPVQKRAGSRPVRPGSPAHHRGEGEPPRRRHGRARDGTSNVLPLAERAGP
jgi:hypothetical protein